jgi:hypothetical protein
VMTAIVFLGLRVIGDPGDNRSQGCARSHPTNAAHVV